MQINPKNKIFKKTKNIGSVKLGQKTRNTQGRLLLT